MANVLHKAGLIRYRRGQTTILDCRGLEDTSCERYRAVRDQFQCLLP